MKGYRILSNAASDADIEAAFEWYESEQPGLGLEFLNEIRATHLRILDEPLKYAVLRSGIRRAITRRFPYGIYFSIEDDVVLIIAVLHTARDPAEWQFRV
ncbi:MAG: type II toxin-antitoxin system RelE/ParE family toxin [Pyrinomonadaceae bacterium]|nr:type II toxin-antitoxin system RelE/ParE family toxin [Pyrinomonadaceae bacterium]MBA3570525.1 type II toxin-antitoxin system RelE/ParE family toxin [Pyrinomonadaceae bacterium]